MSLTRRTIRPDRRHRRGRRVTGLDRRARPREQPVVGVRADARRPSNRASIVLVEQREPARPRQDGARRACSAAFGDGGARRAATPAAPATLIEAHRQEARRQAGERRARLRLDADPPHGHARLHREGQAARRHDPDLRGVRRLRRADGPPGARRSRSTPSSRSISASSPTPRRAPGWCSTATRTTRRRPTSAPRATRDFLAKRQPRVARHHDARRRGVLRLRHRSGSRHAHPAGRREPARHRRAHVLEGVRHGGPAHGLRRRPPRHHQEDGATGTRRRHQLAQRAGDARRRSPRSSRTRAFITAERARNKEVRDFTMKWFADRGMKPTDSQANFMFVNIGRPAKAFREACRAKRRPGRARLPAVREDALPHLVRHDGGDAEGGRGVRRGAREEARGGGVVPSPAKAGRHRSAYFGQTVPWSIFVTGARPL